MTHPIDALDELFSPTAFNSRFASNADLARSFVHPDYFEELLAPEHTVLLGPRGSGKTTALRMLQIDTLAQWNHPLADDFFKKLRFSGVHVPSDYHWTEEWRSFGSTLIPHGLGAAMQAASFTTHVLKCFARSLQVHLQPEPARYLRHRSHSDLHGSVVEQLYDDVGEMWGISTPTPTIPDLVSALNRRSRSLRDARNRLSFFPDEVEECRSLLEPFLFIAWHESILGAIDLINAVTDRPEDQWALLLDELEVAPAAIREEIVHLLRVGEGKLILKLSLLPLTRELSVESRERDPLPGEDYEAILLSAPRIRIRAGSTRNDFSERLASSLLKTLWKGDTASFDPHAIVPEATPNEANREPVEVLAQRLLEVGDEQFRLFLDQYKIDVSRHFDPRDPQHKLLEKVRGVLAARLRTRTLRKRPSFWTNLPYTGLDRILLVLDGNPRRIALFCRLAGSDPSVVKTGVVSPRVQARVLAVLSKRFSDLLETAMVEMDSDPGDWEAVVGLADRLGEFLRNRLIEGPVTPDGPGYFSCDAPDVEHLVRAGLNAGVFMMVPAEANERTVHIHHDREMPDFRLSFVLYPQLNLPTQLGKRTSLSAALSGNPNQLALIEENL